MLTIVLDPGHQKGADSGAWGNGLHEEDLTLDICKQTMPLLRDNGFNVVLTRAGDYVNGPHNTLNESLQARCDIANLAQANLFISVHINAGGGTGIEVFALPGGQAEIAANKALYYLLQQTGMMNRGVKNKSLYVLKNTATPAILVECGFIDNPNDALKLADPIFRQKIARALTKGVCDYFGQEFKEISTKIAQAQPDKVKQAIDLFEQGLKILKDG